MMMLKRKLPKFIDINTFDFTPYGRELTREEAYLVNGGVEIENSIAAQALANPGEILEIIYNTSPFIINQILNNSGMGKFVQLDYIELDGK